MLGLNWFISDPIDFEHKNYLLLSYVSEVEESYSRKELSPYLLWTEKLVSELKLFRLNLENFESSIRRNLIGISKSGLIYSEVNKPEKLDDISFSRNIHRFYISNFSTLVRLFREMNSSDDRSHIFNMDVLE